MFYMQRYILLPNLVPTSVFEPDSKRTKHDKNTSQTQQMLKTVNQYCIGVFIFHIPKWLELESPCLLLKNNLEPRHITFIWPLSSSQTQIHCSHLNRTEQASWLNQLAMTFQAKYWYEGGKLSIKAYIPANKPHLCTKYTTWIISTHLHTQMYNCVNRTDILLRSSEMN